MTTPPAAQLRDARVQFGERVVWRDVNLSVGQGEFVALLGPNGSGKSTLMRVLLGLVALREGLVEVLGQPPRQARPQIGYVAQRHGLDSAQRVRGIEIVRLGLDGARWGVPIGLGRRTRRADAAGRVRSTLELVGATAYAERPIGTLSGGEQQRLLIAQALVGDPELLLLDEPLDSLDLASSLSVTALVGRICRERGVSVMLASHDVNPLLEHIDQVHYLARGRAVSGPPEQVITGPTLSSLYGVPVEVLRASDGRLVVVGTPEPPAIHSPRHHHGPGSAHG